MAEQKRHSNNGLRKICGCPRRTWAKCKHSWHFNFKLKGEPGHRFSVDSEAGEHIEAKTKAEELAGTWRTQIRAGTFQRRGEAVPAAPATTPDVVTLEAFSETYLARVGKPVAANTKTCIKQLVAFPLNGIPFGQKAIGAITEDDLEAIFSAMRTQGKAASTRNKYIQTVKAMFRWAVRKGHLTRNPAGESESLKREKHAQRNRRLEADEEARLLEHAGPHLQRLIIAALETGCRKGELLSLTWRDVNLSRREITIKAERTKTKTGRVIPVSSRLLAVLEMAKSGPTGKAFEPDNFVFGDTVGRRVKEIKRAWETAVLKAHGQTPVWLRDHALSAMSRAAFQAIDVTFHDLRHEAGSRLLEAGWPLHNVAHMLGHANISQTSTYLNATRVGLQDSMRRLDDSRCNSVATETTTDQAPLRNESSESGAQVTVN